MNKIKVLIISIIFLIISTISYAEQKPPIKDVCLYPVYTSQVFDMAWDHNEIGNWVYDVTAVHHITDEVIILLSTTNKTASIQIDKNGLWEIRVEANNSTIPPYASTLNTETCIVDSLPQKWVVYTSPAPPGDPIFD